MSTIAVDCDFQRIHAYCSERGRICYKSLDVGPILSALRAGDTLIYEIASPRFFSSQRQITPAVVSNTMKWVIFNIHIAQIVYAAVPDVLVSPSNVWTNGYEEKAREALCEVTGDNHDIRACRCMLWFYKHKPGQWIPYPEFISQL